MDDKIYKILLVEDDASLGYLLSEYLKIKNLSVQWVQSSKQGISAVEENAYDLAILDVMLPDMDGFDLAEQIKSKAPDLPFIFLTARALKIDVLKGFSKGAIDYIKKPIDEEELVAKIKGLLSRLRTPAQQLENVVFKLGRYQFDSKQYQLVIDGKVTDLTSRESDLLLKLCQKQNELCSHKEILTTVWDKNDYFNRKSLNVFISHLRKYLSEDPSVSIVNVHGRGFMLRT